MRRIIGMVGSAMVVAGVALLVFVAVQYRDRHVTPAAATSHWSTSLKGQGKAIAQKYAKAQTISVPKSSKAPVHRGTEPPVRMQIPSIGMDAPVVDTPPVNGVWDVADWKVGHLSTSPDPGAPGNSAYSAHDDIKGEIFKRLDELKPGDKVILLTRNDRYTYVVSSQQVVVPTDTAPLNGTAAPTITLISCTPYWVDTQRLIVKAVLTSSAAR
jgi:LPXTG-site transpeptidase (sortase) family protein